MSNNYIIIVDDDPTFTKAFINEAAAKNINVAPKTSLEGLKQLLPNHAHKYAAVVLDIKCLIDDKQPKEDSNFIGAALAYLNTTVPGFPRFILTGDESEFNGVKKYHSSEQLFLKTPEDQETLLKELTGCIKNAVPLRVKRENPLPFEAFDKKLLPESKEVKLVNIFLAYEEKDTSKFKGILADIRELHEEIYRQVNARNKAVIRDSFMDGNNSPKFNSQLFKHLEGNPDHFNNHKLTTTPYMDSTMLATTKYIHSTTSEFIHSTSKTKYTITTYTLRALINALQEMIIWSKQY